MNSFTSRQTFQSTEKDCTLSATNLYTFSLFYNGAVGGRGSGQHALVVNDGVSTLTMTVICLLHRAGIMIIFIYSFLISSHKVLGIANLDTVLYHLTSHGSVVTLCGRTGDMAAMLVKCA